MLMIHRRPSIINLHLTSCGSTSNVRFAAQTHSRTYEWIKSMQSRSNFGKCGNSNACVSSPHSSHSTKLESTLKTEPERATCRKPETRPNKLSSKFLLSSILVGPFLHVILFHNLLFRFTFLQNTKNQIKIEEEKKIGHSWVVPQSGSKKCWCVYAAAML